MKKRIVQEERQARLAEARRLYEMSHLSYSGLSKLTGIKAATIASWFTTKDPRAPLAYILKYIRMCLDEYYFVVENGGDFIRHLGNKQLGGFLDDFCSYVLNHSHEEEDNDEDGTDTDDDTNERAGNKTDDIKVNYSEVQHLYDNIPELVESTELPKKIFIIQPAYSVNYNYKDPSEIVIEIYKNTGLTTQEFADALDVPYGTVLHWIRREVVPSAYIVHYVEMIFPPEKTCGDVIRHMDNNEIIKFLTDIYNAAKRANGRIGNLPSKYRDFGEFVESEQTEMVKPRLTAL
jgi:DNA-binding transcriptional regulator YiaG